MYSNGDDQMNLNAILLPGLRLSRKDVVVSPGLITMTTLPRGPRSTA